MATCYLINRTLSSVLNYKTPFEVLFGRAPNLNAIKVLGCLCYVHNKNHKGDKFAIRSRKCIFLGYPFAKKGWLVYDLKTKSFLISWDVKFIEHVFPFKDLLENNVVPSCIGSTQHDNFDDDFEMYKCDDETLCVDLPNATEDNDMWH